MEDVQKQDVTSINIPEETPTTQIEEVCETPTLQQTEEMCEIPQQAEEVGVADTLNLLKTHFDQQVELLEKMNLKFDEKIARDKHKEQLFDKLYDELQSYKTDLYAQILKPFVLSTLSLWDNVNYSLEKLSDDDPATPTLKTYLQNIAESLINILEYNDVNAFEEEDTLFNSRTQQVLKREPTNDPALHNHIAQRVRKGFRWQGVIIKKEYVTVYKCLQGASVQ